jgi:hypothetical protein
MAEHSRCRDTAQQQADRIEKYDGGAHVDVTAVDPHDPFAEFFRCPHGVRYWIVPVKGGTE